VIKQKCKKTAQVILTSSTIALLALAVAFTTSQSADAAGQLRSDMNNDEQIDIGDLALLRVSFGTEDPLADFNDDQLVDSNDLAVMMSEWGNVPVPCIGEPGEYPVNTIDDIRGNERTYFTYVPETYDCEEPIPLLIYLHGSRVYDDQAVGGDFSLEATVDTYNGIDLPSTGLMDQADASNFMILAPDAKYEIEYTLAQWVGTRPGHPTDMVDELFVLDVLDVLSQEYNIDSKRIYVTGFSNGATFTNLLGIKYSDKIAAIAPHSAGLPPEENASIEDSPRQPYPVRFFEESNDWPDQMQKVDDAVEEYELLGFDVELVRVGDLDHSWDSEKNPIIWEFLQEHTLE